MQRIVQIQNLNQVNLTEKKNLKQIICSNNKNFAL